MKHFLSVIVASIIALVMMLSTATAEQTDFSAYEIRDRFTPVEVYMLHGNSVVADTWSDIIPGFRTDKSCGKLPIIRSGISFTSLCLVWTAHAEFLRFL